MKNSDQHDDYIWAKGVYGDVVDGQRYQALRFLEEAMELVQSQGLSREDVNTVADYVYARSIGDESVEIGDVQICLNILSEVRGKSVVDCRVNCLTKNDGRTIEQARAKDNTKMAAGLI